MLLLDTNHCFRIIARDPRLLGHLEHVVTDSIATSVIVAGELTYGASISQQHDENRSAVVRFLTAIDVVPISSEIAGVYGDLKAALLERFGPRERARRRDFDLAKLGFGDNDLWIAASAIELGAILVTADPDFERIAEVADLAIENWMGTNGRVH